MPYRPRQAEFHCPCCGYEANADEQAALNIARKLLFREELGDKVKEASESARRNTQKLWQDWYQKKLAKVWRK